MSVYRGHDIVPAESGFVISRDGAAIGRFGSERECEEFLFVCIVAAEKVPTPELWREWTADSGGHR